MVKTRTIMPLLLTGVILVALGALPKHSRSAVWSPEEEISSDGGAENQSFPSIAAEGGKVHIVWQDAGDGDFDIYYRLFDGTSWQPDEEISTDISDESQGVPELAVEGGDVHVVWTDEGDGDPDVFYRHFNGTDWEPEQEVSSDSIDEDNGLPSIAVENGEIHVVWMDEGDGDWDIYYRHFNGTSWEPEMEISTDAGIENQSFPSIAVENGRVHVVWIDEADGDYDVCYRLYDGIDWKPEEEISIDIETEPQGAPQIAAEDGEVYVVWTYFSLDGPVHIYYRHFDGSDWLPEQMVNVESGEMLDFQFWPDIAVEMGNVYVVWQDGQQWGDPPVVENDIHFRMLYENEWLPEVEVSVDISTEMQAFASIAVEDGTAYFVWQDQGDGDNDIYFRKSENLFPPKSEIVPLSVYWQRESPVTIGWIATDDINLSEVSLFYRHSTDNSSWSDWNMVSTNASVSGTSSSGSFSFDAPDGDGHYEFYSVAEDTHDNLETPPQFADAIAGIDTSSPTIVTVEPADASTDVPVDIIVEMAFSEGMDEAATNEAFSLVQDGSVVDGSIVWSSDGRTLTFHPAEDLEDGKTYQVIVEVSATDVAGNGLTSMSETSFETLESEEELSFLEEYWWVAVLVAIVLMVLILIAWRIRRRPEPEWGMPEEEPTH